MKGGLKRKLKVEARVLLAVERLSADELNARFEEVLAALQLPAAAAEQMRGFDVAKKRQVRCCLSPLPLAPPPPPAELTASPSPLRPITAAPRARRVPDHDRARP